VEIRASAGTMIAPASAGQFDEPREGPLVVGLLIGSVYRLRVTNIPLRAGMEVYPTIEVIDRLYPPVRQEWRFPILVELTAEELEMAIDGKFVTRVVYLENPDTAEPVARRADEQTYFEVADGDDPLAVADTLGRPVAILRMGARLPDAGGPDEAFLYGSPPFVKWEPRKAPPVQVFGNAPSMARGEAGRARRRQGTILRTSAPW
jgi:hypothetical protein